MSSKNIQGFTLIEVMIVVAIIGIIVAVAIPSYQTHIQKSRRADAKTALVGLAQAQETFYADRRRYASNLVAETATIPEVDRNSTMRCRSSFCKVEGENILSPDGHYELTIAARPNSTITASFLLTATARIAQDTDCRKFTLDSIGKKEAKDASNNVTETCW